MSSITGILTSDRDGVAFGYGLTGRLRDPRPDRQAQHATDQIDLPPHRRPHVRHITSGVGRAASPSEHTQPF